MKAATNAHGVWVINDAGVDRKIAYLGTVDKSSIQGHHSQTFPSCWVHTAATAHAHARGTGHLLHGVGTPRNISLSWTANQIVLLDSVLHSLHLDLFWTCVELDGRAPNNNPAAPCKHVHQSMYKYGIQVLFIKNDQEHFKCFLAINLTCTRTLS